jgi:hypothetical protein
MRVSSTEWEKVRSVYAKLSPQEKQRFSGIRTRELKWLLAPEEVAKPQYREIIYTTRKVLEQIFSDHLLTGSYCRELLTRMLVLGETQVFRKCRNVQDPVEIVDSSDLHFQRQQSNPLRAKLEGMAVDLLDDGALDKNDAPDMLMPFEARYGIEEEQFYGLYLHAIRRDRLQRYEPFRSMGTRLNSREQKQWQFYESAGAKGVKADKKDDLRVRICEDSILLVEGSGFQVGAVFDGVGAANNALNIVWQELLKKQLTKKIKMIQLPIDEKEFEACMKRAIRSAQKKMKQIFSLITSSVTLLRRDIPKISTDLVDRFDRICADLKAQGLDVDEELRWYVLNSSAVTTMELVFLTSKGTGMLCRVGDGQSVIVQRKSGKVLPIGTRRKNDDEKTACLGAYRSLRPLEVLPFSIEQGDLVLTMTDGPGDTYESESSLNMLGQLFLKQDSLRAGLNRFCEEVDGNLHKKLDDYALVAMQMTSGS